MEIAEQAAGESRPATVAGGWICSCGFRNRAANLFCGGAGALGCKAERASVLGGAETGAEAVESVEEYARWICYSCKTEHESNALTCEKCKSDRRFQGVLKSVGVDYGFIGCEEASFTRNVWVSRKVLDAAFRKGVATSGVPVRFVIIMNHDGKPNAKAVWLIDKDKVQEDCVLFGSIKYISREKGYGFIECADALEMYGSDVHADLQVLQGCCLGQRISFQVRLGQIGGRPQAVRVKAEGPPPEVTPTSFHGEAARVLQACWHGGIAEAKDWLSGDIPTSWLDAPVQKRNVLLLGDGDLSFAAACSAIHSSCCLDATVFLECYQWHERFEEPEDKNRIAMLQDRAHRVRFGVDATTENCAGFSAVFFNFPNVSITEAQASQDGLTPSGSLARSFLENARTTADVGTLVVLGLWGRCDGGADPRLYGIDSHALVASAIAESLHQEGHKLEDALESGFEREGARADYSYFGPYEDAGYTFRTNWESGFAHKEWHLKACFVLRVVA